MNLITFTLFLVTAGAVLPAGLKPLSGGYANESGFLKIYEGEAGRVELRGTKINSETTAQQKVRVDLVAVKRLYEPRGNPYAGQVTELFRCDAKYMPEKLRVKTPAGETEGLLGGVAARRAFGACDSTKLENWGLYFAYYDLASKMVIEARLFHPSKDRGRAKKALLRLAEEILPASGTE